jgi:hypothetical protein
MSATAKKEAAAPVSSRHAVEIAPLALAVVVGLEGDTWRVRLGGVERLAESDAAVDPGLLREAAASGARVVVEWRGGEPMIVGALATTRVLTIRDDAVEASVKHFRIRARDEVTLKTAGAFVQIKGSEVELYGQRILSRARELSRMIGRMIKLN